MRQMISGLVAAIAVVTVSAAPAMACGGSPCWQTYVPAPVYWGCNSGCGGWGYERLPDSVQQYHPVTYPVHQYYYADQGPTYTGPGNSAPYPVYREGTYWGAHRYHHYGYGYPHVHHWHAYHHSYGYGYREHTLRRYN
jgi:hypothetical protein